MKYKIMNHIVEATVLTHLLRIARKDGSFDLSDPDYPENSPIFKTGMNFNELEDYLLELSSNGAINFDIIGEDGFAPIYFGHVDIKTYHYLLDILSRIDNELKDLNKRVENMLAFSPNKLLDDINDTENTLKELTSKIAGKEKLAPLVKDLNDISNSIGSVKSIARNYDDIYRNIIKPLQVEGRSSIRATVKWAIISIIVSTAITLLISNWTYLFSGQQNTSPKQAPQINSQSQPTPSPNLVPQ